MKTHHIEEHIIKAIKNHEAEAKVEDICREMSIPIGTFYNSRSKYAGLAANHLKHRENSCFTCATLLRQ